MNPTQKQENIIHFIELNTEYRFVGKTASDAYDFIGKYWKRAQLTFDACPVSKISSGFLVGDIARESIPDDSWVFNDTPAPEIF